VDCGSLKTQPDVWVDMTGDLMDKDGNVTGQYSVKAKYSTSPPAATVAEENKDAPVEADVAPAEEVVAAAAPAEEEEEREVAPAEEVAASSEELVDVTPPAVSDGWLEVQALTLTDLRNSEGFFGGKQDPYAEMVIGDGSVWKHVTDVQQDGGKKADWPLDVSGKISVQEVKEGMFTLRAKDEDPAKDKVIGKAGVDMGPLFAAANEWVDLEGDLAYKEELAGHYVIRMRYRTNEDTPVVAETAEVGLVVAAAAPAVEEEEQSRDAPVDDESGYVTVQEIGAWDLKNTGIV
jgi:hypothetical protein